MVRREWLIRTAVGVLLSIGVPAMGQNGQEIGMELRGDLASVEVTEETFLGGVDRASAALDGVEEAGKSLGGSFSGESSVSMNTDRENSSETAVTASGAVQTGGAERGDGDETENGKNGTASVEAEMSVSAERNGVHARMSAGLSAETEQSGQKEKSAGKTRQTQTIDELITRYRQASRERAYEVMNSIKEEIAAMNLREQQKAISRLQSVVNGKAAALENRVEKTYRKTKETLQSKTSSLRQRMHSRRTSAVEKISRTRDRAAQKAKSAMATISGKAASRGSMDPLGALSDGFGFGGGVSGGVSGGFGDLGGGMGDFGGGTGGF